MKFSKKFPLASLAARISKFCLVPKSSNFATSSTVVLVDCRTCLEHEHTSYQKDHILSLCEQWRFYLKSSNILLIFSNFPPNIIRWLCSETVLIFSWNRKISLLELFATQVESVSISSLESQHFPCESWKQWQNPRWNLSKIVVELPDWNLKNFAAWLENGSK